MVLQSEWRYCRKCHAMFFDGYPDKGLCVAGGGHQADGADFNFFLPYDAPEGPNVQASWRYCNKCHMMFYDGVPDKGTCPGGGGHTAQGYNFALPFNIADYPQTQSSWRYCQNCHVMFYDGYPDKGLCQGVMLPEIRIHHPVRHGGHVASGFNFVLPYNIGGHPAADPADLDFHMVGFVWVLSLNHDRTNDLVTVLNLPQRGDALAGLLKKYGLALPADAAAALGEIAAMCAIAIPYIQLMDMLGGYNGVEITGATDRQGVIVTPRIQNKVFNVLVDAARLAVVAATILDFIVSASGQVASMATFFGVGVAANVLGAVMVGTPLGWAVGGALGVAVDILKPAPDPNAHGAVVADRDQPQAWESFWMAQLRGPTEVALLSWQGFFSAQDGGGQGVYANRPTIGDWERWTLIDNQDSTVSFRTSNGHYLTAEEGGGRECQANRPQIGDWERFYIRNLPDGRIALQTHDKGKFVSVLKDS